MGDVHDFAPNKTISRRQFVSGMAGTGLLVAGSGLFLSGCSDNDDETEFLNRIASAFPQAEVRSLTVDASRVGSYLDFLSVAPESYFLEARSFDLPLGSLVFQASDQIACVLTPGPTSRILTSLAILNLATGEMTTLLERALEGAESYCIYDARASNSVITWVESNLSTNDWILYAASLENVPTEAGNNGAAATSPIRMGTPYRLEAGDTVYDPPMLCVYDSTVYWTVMPDAFGPAYMDDSYFKAARINRNGAEASRTLYVSPGRLITNPQATSGFVTIVPRVDTNDVRYQLTALNASTGEVVAISVLPSGVRVSDCVYMRNNFTFSIEGNYTYAQGLRFFGTYEQFDDNSLFYADKPPASPAAFINDCLIIKSTKNVVGFDLFSQASFILVKPSDCVDYGDLLAGCGVQNHLVVYTTIVDKGSAENNIVRLRVYNRV